MIHSGPISPAMVSGPSNHQTGPPVARAPIEDTESAKELAYAAADDGRGDKATAG